MILKDKVAIITGGNSGIGEATALLFAKEGAKVVITARRKEQLEKVAEKIRKINGEVLAVTSDISKAEGCKNVVEEAIKTFGKVDILVNNAGVLDHGLSAIESIKEEDVNFVIDVNAKGTIYFANEVAKVMLPNKSGVIINVASVAGLYGAGGAVYAASKGAVISLTKNIAMRMAREGIRCNAVCPGGVNTPMTKSENLSNMDMNMMGAMMAHSDLKLPTCEPEDVANTIAFLASDKAKAITGQILVTDFGANL
ncbi:SDR family NAD(P)-dependent oxidoreductase [Clostridium celatum]|uniref:Oxidoreductase, short chain dehydrogenase/reductase family protein n=1 Tax=Clostridium celatum DSM 1785 TaxID=545697 RepID=L1QFH8_9CLOT|nr:SDR family oxidoreductase [Clostridium celatum]EKY26706.1 oxidoreductase, short chain dehydrogenase/reductase family protein [Clostridium celatum DSM 1785]MCE9653753.1 SDR family oxidoreductase [Clostridium celatum]MDU3724665.1 SDR family oxidoreductase [Clostridium celatum]MDU6296178.1 SDR family oxidoreductase [Clostridium celatum]MDY3360599.1 SDR family oxidoreductase [Clostridium celatum]